MADQDVSPELENIRAILETRAKLIAQLFVGHPKVTIIARSPDVDDGDVVVTNDELGAVMQAIYKLADPSEWGDKPLPEDAEIKAAFPTRSGRHDLYQEAMRLVGARHSKSALVELVNWLLVREVWLEEATLQKAVDAIGNLRITTTAIDALDAVRDLMKGKKDG